MSEANDPAPVDHERGGDRKFGSVLPIAESKIIPEDISGEVLHFVTNSEDDAKLPRNRITEEEYAGLERRAWEQGMTVGDWARGVLLDHFRNGGPSATPTHMFTELVAIQLVMMNAFEPILRGEKLTREQIAGIFREVQATKATRAQEILLKRTRTKEE